MFALLVTAFSVTSLYLFPGICCEDFSAMQELLDPLASAADAGPQYDMRLMADPAFLARSSPRYL